MNRRFVRSPWLVMSALIALIAACGQPSTTSSGCLTDECADEYQIQGFCTHDADCPADQHCAGGQCATRDIAAAACRQHMDCPVGLFCQTTTERCVVCLVNSHCEPGLACLPDGSCGTPVGCITDDDCGGLSCDVETGVCAPNQDPNNNQSGPPPAGQLIINELLHDPATDDPGTPQIEGDANCDGVRDTYADEFIELSNNSNETFDLTGCTLTVKTTLRHRWSASADPTANLVPPKSGSVVFGGGTPTGSFGNAKVFVASTGDLILANDGATVSLDCPGVDGPVQVDFVSYPTGGNDQSWTRNPDGVVQTSLVRHTTAQPGVPFSPGTCTSGDSFAVCL